MLSVSIKLQKERFQLNVTLSGPDEGVTALFGRSGAGKSTIIKVIAGLLRPDEGRIALGNFVLFDRHLGIDLSAATRRIGCVFQESYLFPHMSVKSNLLYGWRRQKKRTIRFDRIVDLLDLKVLLTESPRILSGGERQRVSIGRALMRHPRLLLLDEPLNSLDAPRQKEILSYLKRLKLELRLPIVYVSHVLEEVLCLADHLILIENGRILAAGTPETIVSDQAFYSLYGNTPYFGSILKGEIIGQDEDHTSTFVSVEGDILRIPQIKEPHGTLLYLYIQAHNVILSRTVPKAFSILNTISVRVEAFESIETQDNVVVHLRHNASKIISLISKYAWQNMKLCPGDTVFALIKTIDIPRVLKK